MNIPDEGIIKQYYELRQQLSTNTDEMQIVITHPDNSLPYLEPGRLVHIKYCDFDFGWGVLVNRSDRKGPKEKTESPPPHECYVLDVLLSIANDSPYPSKPNPLPPGVRPPNKGEKSKMEVVPVLLSCLRDISAIKIPLPRDVQHLSTRTRIKKQLDETKRRFPDGIALVDPIDDMKIADHNFKKTVRVWKLLFLPSLALMMAYRKSKCSNLVLYQTLFTILLS